jgi:hypothetical protein
MEQSGTFGALFSLMCVRLVTKKPLFIRGSGALNHPNYTFSIPDNLFYTLSEGLLASYGSPTCLRKAGPLYTPRLLSPLHTTPFTRPTCLRVAHPSEETGATTRAVPSVPKRFTTPLQPWEGSEASHMPPSARVPSQRMGPAPSAPKPHNAKSTAGKSALINSTHALQVKLVLLLNLFRTYRSPFVQTVRSWRSQLAMRKCF